MKFLPYDKFEIESEMTQEEIISKLSSIVGPKKFFPSSSDKYLFEGNISTKGFEISRITNYKNSFLPLINGKFFFESYGTKIILKLTPNPLGTAFAGGACVWCSLIFLLSLEKIITGEHQISFITLIPIFMIVYAWGLVMLGFCFEAKKQKKMLIGLLAKKDNIGGQVMKNNYPKPPIAKLLIGLFSLGIPVVIFNSLFIHYQNKILGGNLTTFDFILRFIVGVISISAVVFILNIRFWGKLKSKDSKNIKSEASSNKLPPNNS